MRALFYPVLATLLLSAAQPLAAQEIVYGYQAGLTFSTFAGEDVDFDNRTGFVTGGFARLPLTDLFSLQAELAFVHKGGHKTEYTTALDPPQSVNFKRNFDYLEIPVLLNYRAPTPERANATVTAHAGPTFAVLLRSQLHEDGQFRGAARHERTLDVREHTGAIDVGFAFGAGVDIELAGGALFINGRYTMGLLTAYSQDEDGQAARADMEMKNRTIAIFTGFSYPW